MNSSYVQVIEHPMIENAQMTLADEESGVEMYIESVYHKEQRTADGDHQANHSSNSQLH